MPQVYPDTYKASDVIVAATVAELRLQDGADKAVAILLGDAAAYDQALKLYAFDAASEAADDGAAVIKPTSRGDGAGRWRSPAAV